MKILYRFGGWVLVAVVIVGCSGNDETTKQDWLNAKPLQSPSSSSENDDRCALYPWVEGQLDVGMTQAEVIEVIGDADSTDTVETGEVWSWLWGYCGGYDIDPANYVLRFADGELTSYSYQRG